MAADQQPGGKGPEDAAPAAPSRPAPGGTAPSRPAPGGIAALIAQVVPPAGTPNRWTRILLAAALILGGPLLAWPMYHINGQTEALRSWTPVRCTVHESELKDVSRERRGGFRLRAEWAPKIWYSYVWPGDGVNRTSNRVYYFPRLHTPTHKNAWRVVQSFRPGGRCVAFVDPQDPTQSLLVRQQWFRPFGWLLLVLTGLLAALWYAMVEHDWAEAQPSGGVFPLEKADLDKDDRWVLSRSGDSPPAEHDGQTWFRIPAQSWIRDLPKLLPSLLVCILWHYLGRLVWFRYTELPYDDNGPELVVLYHVVGAVLLLRWQYQLGLSLRVGEPQLWINHPRFCVGEPTTLRFRQARRSGWPWSVTFAQVEVNLECREASRRLADDGKKSRRQSKWKHKNLMCLAQDAEVPKRAAGLEAFADIGIPTMHMPETVSDMPARYDWSLEVRVKLQRMPLVYSLRIPLDVEVPAEFR